MKKMISFLAALILVLSFGVSCSSDGSKISMEEFNSINEGMTYEEVCEIIGGEGEQLANTDLGLGDEFVTESYQWECEGSIGANAIIMFQGGKVVTKSQAGLE